MNGERDNNSLIFHQSSLWINCKRHKVHSIFPKILPRVNALIRNEVFLFVSQCCYFWCRLQHFDRILLLFSHNKTFIFKQARDKVLHCSFFVWNLQRGMKKKVRKAPTKSSPFWTSVHDKSLPLALMYTSLPP